MTKDKSLGSGFRRLSKTELTEKMHALQSAAAQESELQEVLHELEVYQIELEMQNRELAESRKALEDSLDRYVSLYDFAPSGYVTLDEIGLIRDINLTMTKILGADRQGLLGRSLSSWVAPQDLRAFRDHITKCRNESGPITTELRFLRKDKTNVFVELMTAPCEDPATTENQFRTSVTDISDRKKAEEERDRFFDLSTDMLSVTGADGYFKRLNPAWARALGYDTEELLSHPFIDFVHPDDRDQTVAHLPKIMQSPNSTPFETRFVKKDRSTIWLTWKSVFAGNVYYSVARDATDEHIEKVEAKNEYNWLREMIEAIPSALILVESRTGNIISKSSGVHDLSEGLDPNIPYSAQVGFTCEDPNGKILSLDETPRMRAAHGQEFNGEHVVWRTPTDVRHLCVYSRNISAKYGRPAMALIVFQDLSNLKKSEQSLSEAVTNLEQEREVRERFVSTLTHDLRTPLSAIKMGSQLTLKNPDDKETIGHLARLVLENVERLDQMIGDLLDANRISAGEQLPLKLKECNFAALAKKTLALLTSIHGDRFKLVGPTHCPAYVDPRCMQRVLENLCNNAVKYGDPKAPVTVAIDLKANHILLSVHNEGIPIPAADQKILFNPFHRSATAQRSGKKGWGIGLTLIRGIVESHGGSVRLFSQEGRGTTFEIQLPQPRSQSDDLKSS